MSSTSGLNVIALVSGGKDSFFSALHCLENGHRLVALANLHPPLASKRDRASAASDGGHLSSKAPAAVGNESWTLAGSGECPAADEDADLNSCMYQTVGYQVIPLYAEATGIPLYRQPILGGAVRTERDYAAVQDGADGSEEDETESMIPLLRAILKDHPEANALSAGAILSNYQRTRVESVALRLGLVPLAYLWKYPTLPSPANVAKDEAQLLLDMAAAGLDPRIIKVASGGLDESFLWENVASAKGVVRLKKAMGRFGSAGLATGAVLGEGGEFETLVVDGPAKLFKKRIVVDEEDQAVIQEGGGLARLKVTRARVKDKAAEERKDLNVRRPDLLDERFAVVLNGLKSKSEATDTALTPTRAYPPPFAFELVYDVDDKAKRGIRTWAICAAPDFAGALTIQEETSGLISKIQTLLIQEDASPASIMSTVIILRSMADFPAINAIYGSLFPTPNPPSRVTISCSDLLPASSGSIAIYVTVQTGATDRQGLHVQSRSYWAPANIGPYSQAISFQVAAGGAKAIHIAGQIPLIPASMDLPTAGLEMHLVLSLQHLWRIGTEVSVQWWTSAAVYFPRTTKSKSTLPPREKARLAWEVWRDAHSWSPPSDGNEDDHGPDMWDRKFNTQYLSYVDAGEEPCLPDYALLKDEGRPVPFFFAVEVDELPRSAEAEWHAHAGLGSLDATTDSIHLCSQESSLAIVEHCILRSEDGGCLHGVVALRISHEESDSVRSLDGYIAAADTLFGETVAKLAKKNGPLATPYLVYASSQVFTPDEISKMMVEGLYKILPCASIYGGQTGKVLGLVALYRELLSSVKEA